MHVDAYQPKPSINCQLPNKQSTHSVDDPGARQGCVGASLLQHQMQLKTAAYKYGYVQALSYCD